MAIDPVSIATGALQTIGSIFGGNAAENERKSRYLQYLSLIHRLKQEDLLATNKRNAGLIGNARQAALTRYAGGGGDPADAESAVLGAEQGAMTLGSQNVQDVLSHYRGLEAGAGADFANRPIEANAGDYLAEGAGALGGYYQNDKYLDMMQKYGTGGGTATNIPPPPNPNRYSDQGYGPVNKYGGYRMRLPQ